MESHDEVVERQKLVTNDAEVEEEPTSQAATAPKPGAGPTPTIKSISSGDTTRSRNSASCSIERTTDKGVSSAKVTYVNERKPRNIHGAGDERFEFKSRPRKLLKEVEGSDNSSLNSITELSSESIMGEPPNKSGSPTAANGRKPSSVYSTGTGTGTGTGAPAPALNSTAATVNSEHSDKFDDRPIKHHSFVSEVPDVKHMERALLGLLDDFHSGKLKAFGSGCTMDQMTKIREQQESLAKLHFELAAAEEDSLEDGKDLNAAKAQENMLQLVHRLEQLSVSIEQLQTSHTGP